MKFILCKENNTFKTVATQHRIIFSKKMEFFKLTLNLKKKYFKNVELKYLHNSFTYINI